ncbi:Crp/Fnr family transcriptional regulator [Cereibacter azotoformans]|uniref:CRP/FNR family transcriptional regulator n=1 Tax=Cereibacter azotoformans TaxID=43057 RepID=A0A2T5K5S3_9RHOB|nr:Crp/Fnr family transcriptional regulator [Cereibacter azotoformans]AXQ95577.1 Crp/Fnr family transcriptional regulator [Cereibacter sphaeroides]PTR17763.1 CRP/FNR family transcriptional regulator [Cereibacter azotoformans]UIJ32178.1 Crp/Fnr family transcriptional regulator [Cereibacter azotoformans]
MTSIAAGDLAHFRSMLDHVSTQTREALLSMVREHEVAQGQVIAAEGSTVAEIGYVLEGALGMIKMLPDDRQHIIGLLIPTDLFGRVYDGPLTYRITALSHSRLVTFPLAEFQALLDQDPELERIFLVHLLDEMDAAREWLMMMNGLKVVERVASFLIILARRAGNGGEVALPLGRKDLAHYLGARPESLSRAFRTLERMQVIESLDAAARRYRICNPKRLAQASGQDLVLD